MLQNPNPLTEAEARQYSPLTLAYLGDGVYELLVRETLVLRDNRPNGTLHREALRFVSAAAQSDGVEAILPLLTETELSLFKRGRNSDATGHRNSDVIQYKRATGLETLFGYLYLIGSTERLSELFSVIYQALSSK
ncbi:MAG: ribonuclease III [Clostridia bacterium]|nr:ribonuclease III [Clostridia bacterium]MBQ2272691.1 ribonuclease III [Clostridia bacterium]MBQ5819928.1 ribonuclease III [Clostridia bacterium]